MKNTQKGFIIPLVIILITLVAIGGGAYIYSTHKTQVDISSDPTDTSVTSSSTAITSNSNLNNNNLSDAQFIVAVGNDSNKTEVITRGDINGDGLEDAIVQQMYCGASCSFDIEAVLNVNNTSAKLLTNASDVYPAFGPAYNGSGAAKSQITNISIKDKAILITGYGLACLNPNTEDVCTDKEWHTSKTITYKFDGKNIMQVNPLPAPFLTSRDSAGGKNLISTVGWKTYDSGRGFSFKYPADFTFDNGNSTAKNIFFTYGDQEQHYLVVNVNNSAVSLVDDVLKQVEKEKADSAQAAAPVSVSYKSYTIGNVFGFLITSQGGDVLRNTTETFKTQKGTTVYSFTYSYAGANVSSNSLYKNIQTIISTFN